MHFIYLRTDFGRVKLHSKFLVQYLRYCSKNEKARR